MSDVKFKIRWSDIGCPTEPGNYYYNGKMIAVKQDHIWSAKGDPDAICSVIGGTSSGETQYVLGAIVRYP